MRLTTCSLAIAACLAVAAPAGAETVVAGRDGLISYYVATEPNQRQHKVVNRDGAGGTLPIPSGVGNQFVPGSPFSVEISPDGRLYAYREMGGSRQERLVIGQVEGGGALTFATAANVPRETGRPHLDGRVGGLAFSPDGRRLAVSTFDDELNLATDIFTLDLLVDEVPSPLPPPHRLPGQVAGVHWDGDRILASQASGPDSFVTVAFDAETYAPRGQVAGAAVRHRGPAGELIGTTFAPGTTVRSDTPGLSGDTDVIRIDTGQKLYDGTAHALPANCFASGSCPEFEQVIDALPAPSGKGYAVLVFRWDRFNKSFARIDLHDENRQFVRALVPEQGSSFTILELQNWSAEPLPVVFVPGFLGSEMTCDGSEGADGMWPALPFPPFERYRLQPDGLSGETGTGRCPSAGPTKILGSALGKPIYSGVEDWLNGMDGVDASFLAWDWRKRPQESIAALDAMIDAARTRAGTDRVQLIAHSYGGLLARVYANSPAQRAKLARVVTLGTPYWGAVKSSFPLVSGEEMIGGGALDSVMEQAELQRFARNLGGLYHLWPSQSFGPWLNTGSGLVGAGAIGPQIEVFGGQPDLHAQSRTLHAATLDGFGGIGDLDWTVVAGTSFPTPVSLTLTPGTGADLEALVAFDEGDGTVPLRSASLGTLPGGGTTPGARRRVVRACVEHVPLPNDSGVQERLLPWLNAGGQIADEEDPCPATGWHVEVHGVDLPSPRRSATNAAPAGQGLADLELAGAVDVFRFGDDLNIVAGPGEVTVPIDAPGATVRLTPLTGASRGATRNFPALAAGVRQLHLGAAEPTLDGQVAPDAPKTGGQPPAGGGPGPTPPAPGGGPGPGVAAPDRLAPRTTAKIKRLRRGRVKVTLRATDRGGSGVARITYRIGKKGKLKRYRRPFTVRAKQLKQLRVGAVDRAGNRERLRLVRR